MTQKELLYIEDTLGHLKFLITNINDISNRVSNEELESSLKDVENKLKKEEKSIKRMQDKEYFESVLNGTKLLSDLLMHGAIESSDDEINKAYIKTLSNVLEIQHDVYKLMEANNWYKMEYVKQSAIDKVIDKECCED